MLLASISTDTTLKDPETLSSSVRDPFRHSRRKLRVILLPMIMGGRSFRTLGDPATSDKTITVGRFIA